MGIGMGMGHVPMGMVMPETVPMLLAPQTSSMQQPQLQLPQLPELPRPSPQVPSLPLMEPLETPQSMSDRPPVMEESEESVCPDCASDVEGLCRCRRRDTRSRHRRRGSVGSGRGGCCSHRKKSECGHNFRRRIMGVLWVVVLLMMMWGAWTMYYGFRHRRPPWMEWINKVRCLIYYSISFKELG